MMKKWHAAIGLMAVVFMAGCGSAETSEQTESSVAVEETQAATESEAAQESGEVQDAAGGYVFTYQGFDICVDADMADILEALGEADSYFEAASCAFEGLDKIYTYGSVEIDTYPSGDVDLVSAVILKDDLVETNEGVAIGASREDIEAVYGTGTEDAGTLSYEKDGMQLCFILEDGKTVSIEYRSGVLN